MWTAGHIFVSIQFQFTNTAFVNVNEPLFLRFLLQKYIFWQFSEMLKLRDKVPLKALSTDFRWQVNVKIWKKKWKVFMQTVSSIFSNK